MDTNTIGYVTGNVVSNPTAATPTIFPASSGGSVRATVGWPAYTELDPTSSAATSLPASVVDGHPFKVKACLKATAIQSENVTFSLYWNSGANTDLTTVTSDKLLISTGTMATGGAASISAYIEAVCLWDSVSQRLATVQMLGLKNIPTPAVINSGAMTISSPNPTTTAKATSDLLQFFATVAFSTSGVGDVATLVELSIGQY